MSTADPSPSPSSPQVPGDSARVERLARLLAKARAGGESVSVADLSADDVPSSAAEAMRIDDRVADLTGVPIRGWKVGCTSIHAQEMLGADGPFPGRVYDLRTSPTNFDRAELQGDALLEGEFAFTVGSDLTPSQLLDLDPDRRRSTVLDAIESVHAAIEVVGGRYDRFIGTTLELIIADAGANRALVLGSGLPLSADGVEAETLVDRRATMTVDGEETGTGTGADVLGDPVAALLWLIDNLVERGIDLTAGQVVTTGTATQVTTLEPGSVAVVTIDGLGSATVERAVEQQ